MNKDTCLRCVPLLLCVLLSVNSAITKADSWHSREFPPRTCEDFNASESNSAITVCRSQYAENRFLLIRKGFANEPENSEQESRRLFDFVFNIVSALSIGGGMNVSSAHYQDPGRWERAADEYARSQYGSSSGIENFRSTCVSYVSGVPAERRECNTYTFDAHPGELVPTWGKWQLIMRKTWTKEGIPVEILDGD